MIELYNYFRSSASFRVRIALNLKKLEFKDIEVHLIKNGGDQFSSEYTKLNFQNLVPTFKDENKIISQSLAIIEYLDETHPAPPLLPTDKYQKALVRAFALTIASDIHPLNNLRVLKFLQQNCGMTDQLKSHWYAHWVQIGFHALEKQLTEVNHGQDFCFGNTPSLADLFLIPQVYNARRFSCDLSAFPTITRIDAHCQMHPAFIKAWPIDQSQ